MDKKNIIIFASGNGTNAANIIKKSKDSFYSVKLIVTNNPHAGVINIAKSNGIPFVLIGKNELKNPNKIIRKLSSFQPDLIVLAGFLLLIPSEIVREFQGKIINIHPALLPKFGGKGMYGMNVHNAVIDTGESHSGITIHYVNEEYDRGDIIFQQEIEVLGEDTPESLAQNIHKLEYEYFPKVIEQLLRD